jgi:hypothetical protein
MGCGGAKFNWEVEGEREREKEEIVVAHVTKPIQCPEDLEPPPLSRQSFGLIDKHRKKPRLGHCVAQINAIFVVTPKISFYCAIGIFLKQMAEDHDQKKNVNFISLFVFIPS